MPFFGQCQLSRPAHIIRKVVFESGTAGSDRITLNLKNFIYFSIPAIFASFLHVESEIK